MFSCCIACLTCLSCCFLLSFFCWHDLFQSSPIIVLHSFIIFLWSNMAELQSPAPVSRQLRTGWCIDLYVPLDVSAASHEFCHSPQTQAPLIWEERQCLTFNIYCTLSNKGFTFIKNKNFTFKFFIRLLHHQLYA